METIGTRLNLLEDIIVKRFRKLVGLEDDVESYLANKKGGNHA